MGKPLPTQSFIKFIGEDRYKPLANFILHYIADLDIPIKRYDFFLSLTLHAWLNQLAEELS